MSNRTVRACPSVSIAPGLDDHSCARRPRESRDERDGRGQDQRARRGHDHHGQRANGVAAQGPGRARHEQRRGKEEPGVAIGHAHERRPVRLGLLHQPHERRIGALDRRPVRSYVERRAGVRGSAQHGHAAADRHRQRLPAERARIDDGLTVDDGAVDRHDLPTAHDDDVAHLHLLDRYLLQAAADAALGDLGSALHQRGQLSACSGRGHILDRRPAREHQADKQPGELFAEQQRADHRYQRDRVDAHVAVDDDRAHDLAGQLDGQQNHRGPPDLVSQRRRRRRDAALRRPRAPAMRMRQGCGRDARRATPRGDREDRYPPSGRPRLAQGMPRRAHGPSVAPAPGWHIRSFGARRPGEAATLQWSVAA